MTLHIVKLPDVGEGVAEAEIVEWHVSVGSEVVEDQLLAAVMTDKATVEIPSPFNGTVREVGAEIGAVMAVGAKLVAIEVAGDATSDGTEAADIAEDTTATADPGPVEKPASASMSTTLPSVAADKDRPMPAPRRALRDKPVASPAVRASALESGVDLRMLDGSGPAGRITHQDIEHFLTCDVPGAGGTTHRRGARLDGVEDIKMTGLRRKIAQKMADATRRIAHFSYIEEVDLTAVEDLRAHLNARWAGQRAKLTVLPFIVRAVVLAVRDFPQMNALYDDEREIITRHAAVNVGIATQTRHGLMVPVVEHAEAHDLWQIAEDISRLAKAARDGTAKREELSGSTITISSLGELGGIATTPVINAPEVAIIGVNRAAIRPMWRHEKFVPRTMMNLSSSFDHRVIDGHDAALFIRCIKGLLEQPATLFIES